MFRLSLPLHLLVGWIPFVYAATVWPFVDIEVPDLEKTINFTMGSEERNFSKYFHDNTWSLNTAELTLDPTRSTMSISEEAPILDRIRNESQVAHCIFEDLFDIRTFRMKQEVENQFLTQITDICKLRLEETETMFASDAPDDLKREKYETIKRSCDLTIEEYTIRVLKTYKEEVKVAASHHYDLRPHDKPRIKYEARIDSHFTRLGFEFLPIVEKYFQMCSDQYFRYFRQLPSCDKNLDEEEEKARFHKNVESATLGSTRKVRTEDLVNVPI